MLRLPPTCTYLLPIRRDQFFKIEAEKFCQYFETLTAAGCKVLVVDGSPSAVFEAHAAIWSSSCRHLPVDARFTYLNGKANAIHTGVDVAETEKIILADDDVRYGAAEIADICQRLERFDVVRPQNFMLPLSWWAKTETARMLINRALLRRADYPGTCAFRRTAMLCAGHYDGDVLFDNEEMIRHFVREGVSVDYASDLFVRKEPPSFAKWLEQRPRQAYEDFALVAKTIFFAALLPVAFLLALLGGWKAVTFFAFALAVTSMLLVVAGWSRGKAAGVFALSNCWFAPLWITERAISTYLAFYWYAFHGGYPFGGRVLRKGVGRDWFIAARKGAVSSGDVIRGGIAEIRG